METQAKWKLLLASRKFWACLVGLAVIIVKAYRPDFPLDEEAVAGMAALLAAYILGVAVEDGVSRRS